MENLLPAFRAPDRMPVRRMRRVSTRPLVSALRGAGASVTANHSRSLGRAQIKHPASQRTGRRNKSYASSNPTLLGAGSSSIWGDSKPRVISGHEPHSPYAPGTSPLSKRQTSFRVRSCAGCGSWCAGCGLRSSVAWSQHRPQGDETDITFADLSTLPITQLIRPAYEYDAPPPEGGEFRGASALGLGETHGVYSGGGVTGVAASGELPRDAAPADAGSRVFTRPSSRHSAGSREASPGPASRGASRSGVRLNLSRGSRRARSRGASRGGALARSASMRHVAPSVAKQLHLVVANSCPDQPADVYLTRPHGSKVTTVELPPGYRVNLVPNGSEAATGEQVAPGRTGEDPLQDLASPRFVGDPRLVPHVTRPITPASSTFASVAPSRNVSPRRGTPTPPASRRSSSGSPQRTRPPSTHSGDGHRGGGDLDVLLFPGVPLDGGAGSADSSHPPSPLGPASGSRPGSSSFSEARDVHTPMDSRPGTAGSFGVRPSSRHSGYSEDVQPIAAVPTRGIFFDFVPGSETAPLRLPCSDADDIAVVIRFCNSDRSHAMETYWVDYDGQLVVRRVLGPGESYLESSWATHPWVVRDRVTDEALLVVVGSDAASLPQFYSAVWNSGELVLLVDAA